MHSQDISPHTFLSPAPHLPLALCPLASVHCPSTSPLASVHCPAFTAPPPTLKLPPATPLSHPHTNPLACHAAPPLPQLHCLGFSHAIAILPAIALLVIFYDPWPLPMNLPPTPRHYLIMNMTAGYMIVDSLGFLLHCLRVKRYVVAGS